MCFFYNIEKVLFISEEYVVCSISSNVVLSNAVLIHFVPKLIREKLLISDGINQNKLRVIYEEYENTKSNIQNITKMIENEGIDNIIFITSPYHTKRAKLLWSRLSNLMFTSQKR